MNLFFLPLSAATISFASFASAQPFGYLNDLGFRNPDNHVVSPEHDGISTWSIATAETMVTNLPEAFEGSLSVEFDFDFSPQGSQLDVGYVLPVSTDGIGVNCSAHIRERIHNNGPEFAVCTIISDWVDTIGAPTTLRFDVLSPGGQNESIDELVWTINPFVPLQAPVKVETISVREPVRKGNVERVRFALNRPANSDMTVIVGLSPPECFAAYEPRLDIGRNVPRDPIYLYDEVAFEEGALFSGMLIRTTECSSNSFVIETWAGGRANTVDPDVYEGRVVDFVVEE